MYKFLSISHYKPKLACSDTVSFNTFYRDLSFMFALFRYKVKSETCDLNIDYMASGAFASNFEASTVWSVDQVSIAPCVNNVTISVPTNSSLVSLVVLARFLASSLDTFYFILQTNCQLLRLDYYDQSSGQFIQNVPFGG